MKTGQIPKVVGGVSAVSAQVARAAYERIVDSVYPVSSAKTAEMAKLLENTYRAVNIGLINEMAQLAHELDIDIWEVIDAASSKPFGFHAFYPGPGVGGHCIPLDPQFLAVAGAGGELRHPLHRPRRAGQHEDALVRGRSGRRSAQQERVAGLRNGDPRRGHRRTSRTSATTVSRHRSRCCGCSRSGAPRCQCSTRSWRTHVSSTTASRRWRPTPTWLGLRRRGDSHRPCRSRSRTGSPTPCPSCSTLEAHSAGQASPGTTSFPL